MINGTVYAPTAAVDLPMSRVSSQVVARTIDLGISPATGYLRPVIEIPPEPVLVTTYPAVIAKPASVTAITGFTARLPARPSTSGTPPSPAMVRRPSHSETGSVVNQELDAAARA